MRRKTFDILLTSGGLVVVIVLAVAGSLLLWGHNFANSNVRAQLAQQQITFPAAGSKALASPQIGPYLNQYAGQQLLTGPQAKAYASHCTSFEHCGRTEAAGWRRQNLTPWAFRGMLTPTDSYRLSGLSV